METLGNIDLLNREKVAFLSSRKVPPAAVMASFDWATSACKNRLCVIGGFQSALERDVLKLLVKGEGASILLVLARKMWRKVPMAYREIIQAGRMLVVSPVSQNITRVSQESAIVRNRFVLQNCTSVIFAALDPNGSLSHLLSEFPDLPHRVLAN